MIPISYNSSVYNIYDTFNDNCPLLCDYVYVCTTIDMILAPPPLWKFLVNIIISTIIFYILRVATFQDKIETNDCRNYKVWNKLSCFRIREFSYTDAGEAYGQTEADYILGMKQ